MDWYNIMFNVENDGAPLLPHGCKEGRFITKDGRVIFIGGPGAGGGRATPGTVLPAGTPWEFPRDKWRIPQEGELTPKGMAFTGWAGWQSLSGAFASGTTATMPELLSKPR